METQIKTITQWLGTGSIDLFGCPFSGKDTQGELLATLVGAELIGGGDILRSHHDPAKIEQVMASGGIIPSDFYEEMVLPYLARPAYKGKPLILSAVGRASGEEEPTMRAAASAGHPFKAAIYLRVPEDEVWRRFEAAQAVGDRGGRDDDTRDVLKNRLRKFTERTVPVIEYYRKKGMLIEVDGTLSREEVTNEIVAALVQRATHI